MDGDMSVARRINAERIVLAGWSRAILMQLAHPLVAQGVADHSTFRGGLWTAAVRLHHTVRAMRRLAFGAEPEVRQTLDRIRAIHRQVNGELREQVGPYAAGTPYSAEDPALVLWVHATLLDSLPRAYEAMVAPLSVEERDEWCRESAPVARALGAEAGVPERWDQVQAYLDEMLTSHRITVGAVARELAGEVLSPRRSGLVAPVRAVNRVVTLGLLPSGLREEYGFQWHDRDQVRFRRTMAALRAVRRLTPPVLAHWPGAG